MIHRLRRSQAVVPFGVGAIVDFRLDALLAAGLESWPAEPLERVDDPRLAKRLGVDFFREPPPGERLRDGPALPFVRFPLWHLCPRCRTLARAEWNDLRAPRCQSKIPPNYRKKKPVDLTGEPRKGDVPCSELPERRRVRMVPLRFVVACRRGHIEDFPWLQWVHSKDEPLKRELTCNDPQLRLITSGLAGLDGLTVRCETCDIGRNLAHAAAPGTFRDYCFGSRPWLGPGGDDTDPCTEEMILLQRGASNIYFANTASSILIPPYTSRASIIMEDPEIWAAMCDGKVPLEARIKFIEVTKKIDAAEVKRAYEEKLAAPASEPEVGDTDDDYRYAEYKALLERKRPVQDDLRLARVALDAYAPWLRSFVEDIVLVEKLAETRALTGFSRIDPDLATDAWVPRLLQLSMDPKQKWLSAIRVYGEGIFLTLRQDRIAYWASSFGSRAGELAQRHSDVSRRRGRPATPVLPSFLVLHTLAHILIRRMSFECGYGSASIRERIYCREPGPKPGMAGVLIYTAAGDSDGTMGGLVQQGRPGRLEALVRGAVEEARWCSSDPLCISCAGQGTDSLNMAACHACALLPETSCETGNRLLDRWCLVGAPQAPGDGFFSGL